VAVMLIDEDRRTGGHGEANRRVLRRY